MLSLSVEFLKKKKKNSKICSGTLSHCRTVWIQIRTDRISALIWIQTVCKGLQQITKVATSKSRVKNHDNFVPWADPEVGDRGSRPSPPEKSQKYRVS